ncbi:MAG: hypothetical protein EPN21_05210 [Methylococcaceae bacterium]|nr:MAG: hypothetical protein EPN21_05210 [Methylococcaceae bacterium]
MKQLTRKSSTKAVLFAMTACAFALLGTSAVSHADGTSAVALASGALSGGPSQSVAACYIFNAGTTPITFVSRKIHSQFDGIIGETFYDDCGTTLAAGGVCGIGSNISNNQGYACRVLIAKGNKPNIVRGVMEIRDSSGNVLANSELR